MLYKVDEFITYQELDKLLLITPRKLNVKNNQNVIRTLSLLRYASLRYTNIRRIEEMFSLNITPLPPNDTQTATR